MPESAHARQFGTSLIALAHSQISHFTFFLVALFSALETIKFFKKVIFRLKLEILRARLRVKIMKYDIGETTSKIVPPMFEEI